MPDENKRLEENKKVNYAAQLTALVSTLSTFEGHLLVRRETVAVSSAAIQPLAESRWQPKRPRAA